MVDLDFTDKDLFGIFTQQLSNAKAVYKVISSLKQRPRQLVVDLINKLLQTIVSGINKDKLRKRELCD